MSSDLDVAPRVQPVNRRLTDVMLWLGIQYGMHAKLQDLQDGDTVTVIKDLKLNRSGGVAKIGARVKNIRLVDSDHDIDCKV